MKVYVLQNCMQDYYGPHFHSVHGSPQAAMLCAQTEHKKSYGTWPNYKELDWQVQRDRSICAGDYEITEHEIVVPEVTAWSAANEEQAEARFNREPEEHEEGCVCAQCQQEFIEDLISGKEQMP